MSLGTEIKGRPEDLSKVAEWLRGSVAAQAVKAGDDLARAKNAASSSWTGEASNRFQGRAGDSGKKADSFADGVKAMAAASDGYASRLRRCQESMGRVRQEAEQAGLRVTATTIEDPGAGPGKPPMLASDSSSESVRQVREAEVAYRRHQQKAEAYRAAQKKVEEIFGDLRLGQTKYLSDLNTARAKAAFTVAGVVYPLSKDIKQRIIDNKYDKWQKKLKGRYERAGESARKAAEKPGVGPAFRDLHERAAASDKVKFAKAGDEIAKIPAKYTPIRSFTSAVKAGAPFAAAGTVADIANGKDPKKAVLSGGTNLLASAATGALAGSVLGPPGSVAGAVVGSLVGVAAGSFASGAVESLYDHQDLGRAGKDGMKAVVQTGKDIAELTSAAAGGVGSLISKIRR